MRSDQTLDGSQQAQATFQAVREYCQRLRKRGAQLTSRYRNNVLRLSQCFNGINIGGGGFVFCFRGIGIFAVCGVCILCAPTWEQHRLDLR